MRCSFHLPIVYDIATDEYRCLCGELRITRAQYWQRRLPGAGMTTALLRATPLALLESVQCGCTPVLGDNTHVVDCWYPALKAGLQALQAREEALQALATEWHTIAQQAEEGRAHAVGELSWHMRGTGDAFEACRQRLQELLRGDA